MCGDVHIGTFQEDLVGISENIKLSDVSVPDSTFDFASSKDNSNNRAENNDEGGTWVSNLSLLHKDKVLFLTRGSLTESICNAAMKVIKPTNSQLDCHQPISADDGLTQDQIYAISMHMAENAKEDSRANLASLVTDLDFTTTYFVKNGQFEKSMELETTIDRQPGAIYASSEANLREMKAKVHKK